MDQELINCWNKVKLPDNFKISTGNALLLLQFINKDIFYLCNYLGIPGNKVFIYLDPPYLMDSRKDRHKQYRYEMSRQQHIELLNIISKVNDIHIAISCYENNLYQEYLSNWNFIKFESQTRLGKATELLYMNYDKPRELHDYNFLGINFRERERLKKIIQRHLERMRRMPEHERNAILHAYQREFKNHNCI